MNRCENCQHWDMIEDGPLGDCHELIGVTTEDGTVAVLALSDDGGAFDAEYREPIMTAAGFLCLWHTPRDPQPAQPPSWKLI